MKNLKQNLTVVLILASFLVYSQKDLGIEAIAPALDSMNLDFFTPTENHVNFRKPRSNRFFKYDSRLKIKSNDMEVLVAFHHDTIENPIATFYPHLEFNRLLNNVVPNDDDQDVLVIGWRDTKVKEKNADWGAEAYIRPRKEITNFPFAKMIAFYKEDYGMVIMLYCFKKPDNVPDLIAFKEEFEN